MEAKEDKKDLRSNIEQEIGKASWDMLASHHERGVVFHVDSSLVIEDVAYAVIKDDSASVRTWMEGGQVTQPTEADITQWTDEKDPTRFKSIIVSPYIFVQCDDA